MIQLVRLQEWRERRRLDQRELARLAGVPIATIRRIELSVHHPRLSTVIKLADALGISADQLLEWTADDPSADADRNKADASVAGTAPRVVQIDGELAAGYVLSVPITVNIWREGNEFVADAPELNVHAFGVDDALAVAHLRERIVSHFEHLEQAGDRLSPRLQGERELLRGLLPVHA